MPTEPSFNVTTTTTEHPECVIPNNPLCPPAPICEDIYLSECVIYNGPEITCAGISTGTPVNIILQDLLTQLSSFCTTTTTSTSTTTTTTTTSTTTTTTTTLPPCSEYELCGTQQGITFFEYTPCGITTSTIVCVDTDQCLTICANNLYPVLNLDGLGTITSTYVSCQATTTTTTIKCPCEVYLLSGDSENPAEIEFTYCGANDSTSITVTQPAQFVCIDTAESVTVLSGTGDYTPTGECCTLSCNGYTIQNDSVTEGDDLLYTFIDCNGDLQGPRTIIFASKEYICCLEGTINITNGIPYTIIPEGPCQLQQMRLQAHSLRYLKMDYLLCTENPITVYWGDGTSTTYPPYTYSLSSISRPHHTYSSVDYPSGYTGDIIIETLDLSKVVTFSILTSTLPTIPVLDPGNVLSNFPVTITGSEFTKLDGLQYCNLVNCHLTATALQLPRTLIILGARYADVSGTTAQLPPIIQGLTLSYYNTISGDIADTPRTLESLEITGDNTISGDIADIPPVNLPLDGLKRITITGNNTITGNLSGIPGGTLGSPLTYFNIQGSNTISGDIANLPCSNLSLLVITGENSVTGDLTNFNGNTTIKVLEILGGGNSISTGNTIFGDLSDLSGCTNLFNLRITGESLNPSTGNTITGNISDLPTSLTDCVLTGHNTITGTLSSLSSFALLERFVLNGDNTLSGDISDIPPTIDFINIEGNNTINAYSVNKVWPTPMYNLRIRSTSPLCTLSTADIDRLLIDLDDLAWSLYVPPNSPGGVLQLSGARTLTPSPSLTAYNSLYTKIVTNLAPYGQLIITP